MPRGIKLLQTDAPGKKLMPRGLHEEDNAATTLKNKRRKIYRCRLRGCLPLMDSQEWGCLDANPAASMPQT